MKHQFQFSTKRLLLIVGGIAVGLSLTLLALKCVHRTRVEHVFTAELKAYSPQIVERDGVSTIVLSGTPDKLLVIDQKEAVLLLGVSTKNSVLLQNCFITSDAKIILNEHQHLRARLDFKECEFER